MIRRLWASAYATRVVMNRVTRPLLAAFVDRHVQSAGDEHEKFQIVWLFRYREYDVLESKRMQYDVPI